MYFVVIFVAKRAFKNFFIQTSSWKCVKSLKLHLLRVPHTLDLSALQNVFQSRSMSQKEWCRSVKNNSKVITFISHFIAFKTFKKSCLPSFLFVSPNEFSHTEGTINYLFIFQIYSHIKFVQMNNKMM